MISLSCISQYAISFFPILYMSLQHIIWITELISIPEILFHFHIRKRTLIAARKHNLDPYLHGYKVPRGTPSPRLTPRQYLTVMQPVYLSSDRRCSTALHFQPISFEWSRTPHIYHLHTMHTRLLILFVSVLVVIGLSLHRIPLFSPVAVRGDIAVAERVPPRPLVPPLSYALRPRPGLSLSHRAVEAGDPISSNRQPPLHGISLPAVQPHIFSRSHARPTFRFKRMIEPTSIRHSANDPQEHTVYHSVLSPTTKWLFWPWINLDGENKPKDKHDEVDKGAGCSEQRFCGCSGGYCWLSCGKVPYDFDTGEGMWCWSTPFGKGSRKWAACDRYSDCGRKWSCAYECADG